MVQLVMQQYGLQSEQIAVIGDRLDTDIVCARRAGVAALLVTTGVTNLQQARRAKGELRPDAVFPDLTTFAEMVLQNSPSTPLETDDLPTSVSVPVIAAPPVETPFSETPFAETPVASAFGITEIADNFATESTPAAPETPVETPAEAPLETPIFSGEPLATETFITESIAVEEAPGSETAKPEGWDDSWFEENAETETPVSEVEVEAEATESTSAVDSADDSAKSDAPKDDGFSWKLD